jgi:hypothetical protein
MKIVNQNLHSVSKFHLEAVPFDDKEYHWRKKTKADYFRDFAGDD